MKIGCDLWYRNSNDSDVKSHKEGTKAERDYDDGELPSMEV